MSSYGVESVIDQVRRASACLDLGMVAPGWHGRHVVEHLPFDVVLRGRRIAACLPRGHPGEALLERVQRAAFVGAVSAVPAALDGHAATFTAGRRGHGFFLRQV